MNIFEQASRKKLRFASNKGDLTTEQLWDLPLTSRTGFDLDTVARTVNTDLKATAEESFVATTSNTARQLNELKLEVVKFVIADKIAAQEAAKSAANRRAERDRLLEILNQKQDQELLNMSADEIKRRLAELDV